VVPNFPADLVTLARVRPVWIVDTAENGPRVEAAWKIGRDLDIFEISRCKLANPADRVTNVFEILGVLDDPAGSYDFFADGLEADESLRQVPG
jgi:hypothetical protein